MDRQANDAKVVSLALFNNAAFTEVIAAADRILQVAPNTVTTRQVAAATGRSDSVVRPVMKRLVSAGLLAEPTPTHERAPCPFTRTDPDLWDSLLAVVAVVTGYDTMPRPAPR